MCAGEGCCKGPRENSPLLAQPPTNGKAGVQGRQGSRRTRRRKGERGGEEGGESTAQRQEQPWGVPASRGQRPHRGGGSRAGFPLRARVRPLERAPAGADAPQTGSAPGNPGRASCSEVFPEPSPQTRLGAVHSTLDRFGSYTPSDGIGASSGNPPVKSGCMSCLQRFALSR